MGWAMGLIVVCFIPLLLLWVLSEWWAPSRRMARRVAKLSKGRAHMASLARDNGGGSFVSVHVRSDTSPSPCPQCGMTDATQCRRFDCKRQWGGLYPTHGADNKGAL